MRRAGPRPAAPAHALRRAARRGPPAGRAWAGTADRMLQPDQRTGRHRDQFGRAGERGGQVSGKLSASRGQGVKRRSASGGSASQADISACTAASRPCAAGARRAAHSSAARPRASSQAASAPAPGCSRWTAARRPARRAAAGPPGWLHWGCRCAMLGPVHCSAARNESAAPAPARAPSRIEVEAGTADAQVDRIDGLAQIHMGGVMRIAAGRQTRVQADAHRSAGRGGSGRASRRPGDPPRRRAPAAGRTTAMRDPPRRSPGAAAARRRGAAAVRAARGLGDRLGQTQAASSGTMKSSPAAVGASIAASCAAACVPAGSSPPCPAGNATAGGSVSRCPRRHRWSLSRAIPPCRRAETSSPRAHWRQERYRPGAGGTTALRPTRTLAPHRGGGDRPGPSTSVPDSGCKPAAPAAAGEAVHR